MLKKGSQTNPKDVLTAEQQGKRNVTAANAKCMMQFVLTAALRLRFLSNRQAKDRSTATSVSKKEETVIKSIHK